MRSFISYILVRLVLLFVSLELFTRAFGISGHTVPSANLNGNLLHRPFTDSLWVRGGFGEISSHYVINGQGYNSLLDYNQKDTAKINIALVGDSYIQGFQVNVGNSIGRLLDSITDGLTVTHEYGHSGGNINDFIYLIDSLYVIYDQVFVLMTEKDLSPRKPSYINRGRQQTSPPSFLRQVYANSSALRYLNINHGINIKVSTLLREGPNALHILKNLLLSKQNSDEIQSFEGYYKKLAAIAGLTNVTILFEEGKFNPIEARDYRIRTKLIEHELMPKNCGFDSHWNVNGRKNCARAMEEALADNR
jgi:hypothetical protein